MRYDFVEAHRGRWPVRLMGRVLAVSPGGYYDWRGRPTSDTARSREALVISDNYFSRPAIIRIPGP